MTSQSGAYLVMTEAPASWPHGDRTPDPGTDERDFAGFSVRTVVEVVGLAYGEHAAARVASRIHVSNRAWCRWQDLDAAFQAVEEMVPGVDIAELARHWHHRSRGAMPLIAMLRSGLPPEWLYRNAPSIVRLFAPTLAVETTEHRRGVLIEFEYRIRFPSAWSPRIRLWVAGVIGDSHRHLPAQSPRVHGLEVIEEPSSDPDTVRWRLRWYASPGWGGLLATMGVAMVLYATAPAPWNVLLAGCGVAAGWWIGIRRPVSSDAVIGDLLRLSDHQNRANSDIEQRRRHLRSLERRHQAGLIAARCVHELSNPLTSISFAATRLRSDPHDAEAMAQLQAAIARAERIVGTVRSAHAATPPPRARMTVHAMLELLADVIESHCGRGSAALTADIPGGEVCLVDGAIELIAGNLARNASEAADPPRPCRVRCWAIAGEGTVDVYIADNGRGMDPQTATAAMQGISTKPGGLGIGLALCRELCVQSGAVLRLHATAPSQGTTFRITLPLAATPPTQPAATPC